MHAYIAGNPFVAELVIAVALGLGMFLKVLTAAQLDEAEQLLAFGIRDALGAAHIEIKQAAACMRMDESQLRRQLRGEPSQHVSLTRLIRLPFSFWLFFGPALIQIVYRKRMQEMAEVLSEVKRGA